MRKRYRILLLTAVVAALVVPVGFALSVEPSAASAPFATSVTTTASGPVGASTALPVSAKLLLMGTTFFGVAAFVRKSV